MFNFKKIRLPLIILAVIVLVGATFYLAKRDKSEDNLYILPANANVNAEQAETFNQAVETLKKNNLSDREKRDAYVVIAQVRYQMYDLVGSEEVYLKALAVSPEDVIILNNLADIYQQQGRYVDAADKYLKTIETTPKWVNAYRELTYLYKFNLKDRYNENLEKILLAGFKASQSLGGPGDVDYCTLLAMYYEDTGQIDKAIEYYEKTVELDPKNTAAADQLKTLKASQKTP